MVGVVECQVGEIVVMCGVAVAVDGGGEVVAGNFGYSGCFTMSCFQTTSCHV